MVFTVYILQSLKDGSYYTGLTRDLERRIKEHNLGWEQPTRNHRPYKIIFSRIFSDRLEARRVEKKLKSGYLREKRNNILELLKYLK